jgi:1,2-diacylglycerol 3-beta-galactosyltransferase
MEEQEIGIVLSSYDGLCDAVRELLAPERYGRLRKKLEAIENRAVYEIPGMLEKILRGPGRPIHSAKQPQTQYHV